MDVHKHLRLRGSPSAPIRHEWEGNPQRCIWCRTLRDPGDVADCAKCGCMKINHIPSDRTEMKQKCLSCDKCDGYKAKEEPDADLPVRMFEVRQSY
jgi:hypothetical protein